MRTVVRARVDRATRDEVAAIPDTISPAVSDAFRMMMRRMDTERRLLFDPLVPSATTIAAIEAARRGELETADSIDDVFEQLDHNDLAE